jgi:ABC-type transport system substrate-binding protein
VFREPEVRRAFSAAIDRQRIIDELYAGSGW